MTKAERAEMIARLSRMLEEASDSILRMVYFAVLLQTEKDE